MNYSQGLQIPQAIHQLDGESANDSLLKALVVMQLNELVKIESIEIKRHAQVISEHEIVLDLDHRFSILWIILLQK